MPYYFENKDNAKKAASKSRRGRDKLPHELKMILIEGVAERVPNLWEALEKLEDKPRDYLRYLIEVAKLVIPKDLKITGDVKIESDARARLIERLTKQIDQADDNESDNRADK